jgi:hypothetical protein
VARPQETNLVDFISAHDEQGFTLRREAAASSQQQPFFVVWKLCMGGYRDMHTVLIPAHSRMACFFGDIRLVEEMTCMGSIKAASSAKPCITITVLSQWHVPLVVWSVEH